MKQYIYKYLSFPAFVDMVQRKALHFVLPSVWEDTEENSFVYEWAKGLDEALNKWMIFLFVNRTYAQSWTSLEESDAMWRIYSYGNQAIRVKVSVSSIEQLSGVNIVPVVYSDTLIPYSENDISHSEMLQRYIAQKRIAFEHEKEVRLLYIDRVEEQKVEPAIRNMYYFLKCKSDTAEDIDYSHINIDEMKEYIDYSNICEARPYLNISFESISGFIEGVMVHPLAAEWYADVVRMFCENNNIQFEGKSQLYRNN